MSEKALDRKGRWRSITVSFRASEEENRVINEMAKLSGLTKQAYIITRLQNKDVIVKGNPRVFKALKDTMHEILDELKRIQSGQSIDEQLLDTINNVATIFKETIKQGDSLGAKLEGGDT